MNKTDKNCITYLYELMLIGGHMKITTIISFILVLVGAFVWGLIGLFDFNIVAFIFGEGSSAVISRIIYSLVGLSSIWLIVYASLYNPFEKLA